MEMEMEMEMERRERERDGRNCIAPSVINMHSFLDMDEWGDD
jgi:hypothetical protein